MHDKQKAFYFRNRKNLTRRLSQKHIQAIQKKLVVKIESKLL